MIEIEQPTQQEESIERSEMIRAAVGKLERVIPVRNDNKHAYSR